MNPFKTLGVAENATQEEIKKVYRNLSKKYHPDVNPGDKAAEEKFKQISEAYSMIDSEEKIKQLHARQANPFMWDETFSHIFGDFFGQKNRGPMNRKAYVNLNVTLQEIFTGGTKDFNYQVPSTCKNCGGTGAIAFNHVGQPIKICEVCKGQGSTYEIKSARVTIPRGVDHGSRINAEGNNVEVTLHIIPHAQFQKNGSNIISEQEVLLVDVFNSTEIVTPTLHGEVKIKIPKFIQHGSLLRVKGKGMYDSRRNNYGDHIIKIKIIIPNNLTETDCNKIVEILNGKEKE